VITRHDEAVEDRDRIRVAYDAVRADLTRIRQGPLQSLGSCRRVIRKQEETQ
jgi:hypothetical protein